MAILGNHVLPKMNITPSLGRPEAPEPAQAPGPQVGQDALEQSPATSSFNYNPFPRQSRW